MKLDIIIPIYNEAENLPELFRRVKATCNTIDMDWQVIYVNDGSTDDSANIMLRQRQDDPRVAIIELSRNFGLQAAIAAGLSHAEADAVLLMDGDLQDPPELIPELIDKWRQGAQVVLPRKQSRKERGIRRLGFDGFHKLFSFLTDYPIPSQTGIFGLLDKQVVKELKNFNEKNRFFPGLRSWVGFKQVMVHYHRDDRSVGKPKQTLKRLVRYAFDAIFSFSYKPLRIMTGFGIVVSICGFILAVLFVIKRLMGIEVAQTGFTTLISVILFLGGIQIISVGLLGEYLARVFDEVRQRPLYIVKKCFGLNCLGKDK